MSATEQSALQGFLSAGAASIDDLLDRSIPPLGTSPAALHEAQRYALLAPGKRLRGVLVLAVSDMLRGARPAALPLAAAVEMVHASSLILDDLPSMDDAKLRRGQPTLHRAHGESTAILVAVGLLTRAFALIEESALLRPKVRGAAVLSLAQAIGADGLIGGQFADLESTPKKKIDLDMLEYIHSHKTGALFIAAAELGVLAADGHARDAAAGRAFAKNLGLAFQITDDLLDYSGDARVMGKDVGLDRNKTTFAHVCGIDGARRLVDELIDAANAALEPFGRRGRLLCSLAELVRGRDR